MAVADFWARGRRSFDTSVEFRIGIDAINEANGVGAECAHGFAGESQLHGLPFVTARRSMVMTMAGMNPRFTSG